MSPGWEVIPRISGDLPPGYWQPGRYQIPIHEGIAILNTDLFNRVVTFDENDFWRPKVHGAVRKNNIGGEWFLEWYVQNVRLNLSIERRPIRVVPDVWYEMILSNFVKELYPCPTSNPV